VEYLISDYSRQGYIDGLTVRLPTIVVRLGSPNAAASDFLSSIIREPLAGEKTILPVSAENQVWLSSPMAAVKNLMHAARLPRRSYGNATTINMPRITVSIQEMIDSLKLISGNDLSKFIVEERNDLVEQIVCSWPYSFNVSTAKKLVL